MACTFEATIGGKCIAFLDEMLPEAMEHLI